MVEVVVNLCFMSPQKISTLVMLVFLTAIQGAESATQHVAQLENASLQVVIADNEAFGAEHRTGYNGVADLRLAPRGVKNLFVPNYAGLKSGARVQRRCHVF